jgi:arylsulfatase A-like enzyme
MRLLLLAPCSLLLATLCPAAPHVVLIMTDDQGYGDLACHGNKHIVTPNLDRLHGESLRLTNFHVNSACAPTRAALMTGRTAMRTGVWHVVMGRTILHNDEITMAELFRKNGYRTAMFGKWHLGDSYPFRPQDQGFEEVLTHGGGVVGHTPDYWMNDYFDDTYLHNGKWEKQKGYCTDVWIDGAIKFLDQNRAKPCFVYLPLNAPHGPFEVPERFEAMYRDNPEVPHAAFYGMITAIDEAVGRLDKALTRLGIRDDTILIFLTDNGTSKGIQYRIVAGPLQNGFWHVVVARAGTYAFRLRRWPKESGLKINEHADHLERPEKPWHPLEPGKLTATRARVRVGDVEKTTPVPAGAEEVELRLVLDHGSARLQTWFIDAEDQSRGAYYVEVERLSE